LVVVLGIGLCSGSVVADHSEWDEEDEEWEEDELSAKYDNATELGYGVAANNTNFNLTLVNSTESSYKFEFTQTNATLVFLNKSNSTIRLLDDWEIYVAGHGELEPEDFEDGEDDIAAFTVEENHTVYVTEEGGSLDESLTDFDFSNSSDMEVERDEWENETDEREWNRSVRINQTHRDNTTVTLANKSRDNVTLLVDSQNNGSADFYVKKSVVLEEFGATSLEEVDLYIDDVRFPFYEVTENGTAWVAFEIPHFSTREASFRYTGTRASGASTNDAFLGIPVFFGTIFQLPYWILGLVSLLVVIGGGYWYREQQMMYMN